MPFAAHTIAAGTCAGIHVVDPPQRHARYPRSSSEQNGRCGNGLRADCLAAVALPRGADALAMSHVHCRTVPP